MRYNFLIGGKAGQGPNFLTHFLAETLVNMGYYVFYSRDYQSLIRGGHNFNVLTFSDSPIYSNDAKIDVLIELDENTEKLHKKELKKGSIILKGQPENMYYAGSMFKLLGFNLKYLETRIKELKKRVDENLKNAKKGFEEEKRSLCKLKPRKGKTIFTSGSESTAQGAIDSGINIYYAYPMTPATPVLGELAEKQIKGTFAVIELENEISIMIKGTFAVIELENEISIINAAIGSAITGAKSMIGTSGGGFDLMSEGLTMAGMAEIPLVCYLAQRPGPASGVPTYTGQGDLNMARHCGHGEFPRLVLAPGDPTECAELISQAFYFSQKFKTPAIVISDKHLAESYYTQDSKAKITQSKKQTSLAKYNSYEHDNQGIATEDAKIIKQGVERRLKKQKGIEKEAKKFTGYKTHGKKNSKNLIIGWGSTKGAILDAIKDLNCGFLQILYIEPFPEKIKDLLKGKNIILVENNSTAQLTGLIAEKIGVFIDAKNKILRYDARPFLCDELKKEIKGRLR